MEDSHRRSINISMGLVGANAFRASDCDGGMGRAIENWNPEFQAQPTQPDWGARKHQRDAKVSQPPWSVHGLKIRSRQTPLLDCSAMARDKLRSPRMLNQTAEADNSQRVIVQNRSRTLVTSCSGQKTPRTGSLALLLSGYITVIRSFSSAMYVHTSL